MSSGPVLPAAPGGVSDETVAFAAGLIDRSGKAPVIEAALARPTGRRWIVPIVNLWFPFQIMGDIWRAGLPAEQRSETAWLPALWWTCWLLSGLGIFGAGSMSTSGLVPHIAAGTNTASLCFLAVAGALLIAIIRTVSDGPVGSPLS